MGQGGVGWDGVGWGGWGWGGVGQQRPLHAKSQQTLPPLLIPLLTPTHPPAGKAVCGSWLWLAVEAVLCAVWWLILFWLVFVIFGSCLWYGAAYTVRGVLRTSINTANQFNNMTETAKANSNLTAFSPPPPASGNMTLCGQGCLNLALFDFLVQVGVLRRGGGGGESGAAAGDVGAGSAPLRSAA